MMGTTPNPYVIYKALIEEDRARAEEAARLLKEHESAEMKRRLETAHARLSDFFGPEILTDGWDISFDPSYTPAATANWDYEMHLIFKAKVEVDVEHVGRVLHFSFPIRESFQYVKDDEVWHADWQHGGSTRRGSYGIYRRDGDQMTRR